MAAGLTVSSVVVAHVSTQRVSVAFTVHGAFALRDPAWVAGIEVSDDRSEAVAVAMKIGAPEVCAFSFVHPGYKAVGAYTLTVRVLGASAKSNEFEVVEK